MDSSSSGLTKRRRTVNKSEWSKEKRKRLRIAGKEYLNSKGEFVNERQPGPDCECRRKCFERIPKSSRMKLFKGYYALKSHDEQNAYLFGLIRKVPIARKRAEGSTRRTCTFNYYIRIGGQEQQVCVRALASIHGVGKSKIHILCEKLGQNILFPRDERGRHSKMPKKVSDETVEMVRNHIASIIRSDRARDFLKDEKANNGPDVNITQMHKDFLDTYDPEYAQELINYEKIHGVSPDNEEQSDAAANTLTIFQNANQTWEFSYQREQPAAQPQQQLQLVVDSAGNTHQVVTPADPLLIPPTSVKKKRKTTKDGRPEPIVRQWFYSKIFHEMYSSKEAVALRKKVLGWKCNEDFTAPKPARKQRGYKKSQVVPQTGEQLQLQVQPQLQLPAAQQLQQVQIIQARVKGANTFSIPIATQQIPAKIQLQSIPIKKKPVQVFGTSSGTQGQDNMYSIYPMILQDLTGLEGHAVPIQHFQGQPMAITATNLQALGVNINIAQPNGQPTVSVAPTVMSYKFE